MNTKNGYCLTEEEADPAKLNVADLIDLFFQQYFYIFVCFGEVYLYSVEVLQEQ